LLPFSPLHYDTVPGRSELFYITQVSGVYSPGEPAMWEVFLDWSHVPEYELLPDSSCRARVWYYSLTTVDVSQIFSPQQEQVIFPEGTRIVEKKYSLTLQHEEFIRGMLSETVWRGGYFDVTPANITTNLSEGAIGYFGACTVDSVIIIASR
ncbi:MAG: hypothetical protein KJ607_01460, partial [Bacteroidetes bacterium]|nr:hypothetical protein [Bacteroidota bacterium]